jgi:hypothetical protein
MHDGIVERCMMIKHLLSGVAAVFLTSGIAFGQVYAPPPPPAPYVPGPPPAPAAPPIPPPAFGTTTTVAPGPDGDYRASTTTKGVDAVGNEVTKKKTYEEGAAGSTETRTKTETDPVTGTTTRSTTTTTTTDR